MNFNLKYTHPSDKVEFILTDKPLAEVAKLYDELKLLAFYRMGKLKKVPYGKKPRKIKAKEIDSYTNFLINN